MKYSLSPSIEPLIGPYLLTIAKLLYWGRYIYKKTPSDEILELMQKIVDWNAFLFAPAAEKCLDAVLLMKLLQKYSIPAGRVLFEAVNNARFENDVLCKFDISKWIIDVNDLGIQFDFNMNSLKSKRWINEVFICSYDDIPVHEKKYDLIICNNGYSASKNIKKTIQNQLKMLNPKGKLIFNLHLPHHVDNIMIINKLYSLAILNVKEYKRFRKIELDRFFSSIISIQEAVNITLECNVKILEERPYLDGFYRKVGNYFLWPVYMKYFSVLSANASSATWDKYISDFKKWFPYVCRNYCDDQLNFHNKKNNSAKVYFVLEYSN